MDNLIVFWAVAAPVVMGVTKGINTKLEEQFGINSSSSKEAVTLLVTLGATLYYALFEAPNENPIIYVSCYIVVYIGASGIYQWTPKKKVEGGQTPINTELENEEE